jgi:hypothetical protein
MTEIHGSIPVFSFVIPSNGEPLRTAPTPQHLVVVKMLTEKLQKMGYRWYVDFKYSEDQSGGTLFEVYNEKLVTIVKELVVEYNI